MYNSLLNPTTSSYITECFLGNVDPRIFPIITPLSHKIHSPKKGVSENGPNQWHSMDTFFCHSCNQILSPGIVALCQVRVVMTILILNTSNFVIIINFTRQHRNKCSFFPRRIMSYFFFCGGEILITRIEQEENSGLIQQDFQLFKLNIIYWIRNYFLDSLDLN